MSMLCPFEETNHFTMWKFYHIMDFEPLLPHGRLSVGFLAQATIIHLPLRSADLSVSLWLMPAVSVILADYY